MSGILSFLPLISGAFGALVGAVLSRFLVQKRERLEATIDMYNRWHSVEMSRDRKIAWKFMTGEYVESPYPIHHLFNDKSRLDNEIIDSVQRVLYFWHLFYVLKKQNMLLDKTLPGLFRYQYSHWIEILDPIYLATINDGKDIPEWCELFEEKEKKWILETTKNVEYHANKAN